MTMKDSFCQELVKECDGEISFPTYDGLSYCEKHVGDGGDQFWSYPYTERERVISVCMGFMRMTLISSRL